MFAIQLRDTDMVLCFHAMKDGTPVPVAIVTQEEFEKSAEVDDVIIFPMDRALCVARVKNVRTPDEKHRRGNEIEFVYSIHNMNELPVRERLKQNVRDINEQ